MKKIIIFLIIIIVIISTNLNPISHNLIKVISLLTKISSEINKYSDKFDEYYQDFNKFYKKNWEKYFSKFSLKEISVFDTWASDFIYQKSYIDHENINEKWKSIYQNPENLKNNFPNLYYMDHYKDNPEYKKNRKFRININKNIKVESEFLKNIESLITLIVNTRRIQKLRGLKIREFKQYIRNFSKPSGREEVRMGRLIGLGVIIDHEIEKQFIELISLMNAQMEIDIKSSIMEKNINKKNSINNLNYTK